MSYGASYHQLAIYQEIVVVDNGDSDGSEKESKILLCCETEAKFQLVLTESEHYSGLYLTTIQFMNH